MEIHDRFFSNQLQYRLKLPFTKTTVLRWSAPERGDIIAFAYPADESLTFVKRVIAVPDDVVEMRDGVLLLNHSVVAEDSLPTRMIYQESLSESCQYRIKHLYGRGVGSFGPTVVPKDHYFGLGDNREDSKDSRFWGFVPFHNIEGKMLYRWFALKDNEEGLFWERLGNITC